MLKKSHPALLYARKWVDILRYLTSEYYVDITLIIDVDSIKTALNTEMVENIKTVKTVEYIEIIETA